MRFRVLEDSRGPSGTVYILTRSMILSVYILMISCASGVQLADQVPLHPIDPVHHQPVVRQIHHKLVDQVHLPLSTQLMETTVLITKRIEKTHSHLRKLR